MYRVLRRAGIAGILPAGVWLCRLQRNFGRFLPAGIFRWFYVFAGWRSFCLSKTDPKRRNALVSILVVAEPSDGRPRVASKCASRLEHAESRCACFGHGQRDDHESRVHACQITCKWRRMPRGTSGRLSVACARDLARWRVTPGLMTASIARSSEMRERPSFVDREKGFWRRWEVGFCQLHFVWTSLVEGRYIVVRHAKMDHARGLEDFVLKTQKKGQRKKQREREDFGRFCAQTQKKRQIKKQRERERERERKQQTKESERTNKCAEDTNNLLVKFQEIFSLAEMQFSFLKLTFFIVVGPLFVQRNCHKLDFATRKCVKIFKRNSQKCQIFSIRNDPKIPKNAYFGCKSPKFFRGRAPGPPTHWQASPAFSPAGKNSCGEPWCIHYFPRPSQYRPICSKKLS